MNKKFDCQVGEVFPIVDREIASRLGDSYVFLGHEGNSWYFLQ